MMNTPASIVFTSACKRNWVLSLAFACIALMISGCIVPIDPVTGSISTVQLQTQPVIAVAPLAGEPGTQVAVSGSGWQANDTVILKLESIDQRQEEVIYAFTASNEGTFATSFPFPQAPPWSNLAEVRVVAVSSVTNFRVIMPFEVSTSQTAVSGPTPTWTSVSSATATRPTATVPSIAPTATSTPLRLQADIARVLSPGLNVRGGPSANYPILAQVTQGTALTVLGQSANGGWLQVQLSNGMVGWVARIYTDYGGGVVIIPQPPPPVTPTHTPITIVAGPITEWRGEYYNNRNLTGPISYVRNDSNVNFNWGSGGPEGLPSDNFSIRWTRTVELASDEYRFHVRMDDGARLYVDDKLLIDRWRDDSVKEYTSDIWLNGGFHNIRVEYYEHTGTAEISVWWEPKPDNGNGDDDDDDDDQTDNDDTVFPEWRGEYYTNRNLDGNPRLRRNDREINFNWGSGSPSSRIPDHNFSVRWTRTIQFAPGRYRFNVIADDGVRVYVDGDRIINEWNDSVADNTYSAERDLSGNHRIQVDYYERTGGARIRFWWDQIGVPPTATPIPTDTPGVVDPTATPTPIPPTPTWVVQPSANVQPGGGGQGTAITVSGGAFPPNVKVNVLLGALAGVQAAGASADPAVYASTTTDRTGSYSLNFTMPAAWNGGEPIPSGDILLLVATEDFSVQASAIFAYVAAAPTATPTGTPVPTFTPTATFTPIPQATPTPVPQPFVNLNPSSGEAGTSITVSGGGFPSNLQVNLYLGLFDGAVDPNSNPTIYRTTTTDTNGNYSMNIVMPETAPDGTVIPAGQVLFLVANGDFSLRASALFNFVVPEPVAPASVPTDTPTAVPPTDTPTEIPTLIPTDTPTEVPTPVPTETPTLIPTDTPTEIPTLIPTDTPTEIPTPVPTDTPTPIPTEAPEEQPGPQPTDAPIEEP